MAGRGQEEDKKKRILPLIHSLSFYLSLFYLLKYKFVECPTVKCKSNESPGHRLWGGDSCQGLIILYCRCWA